MSVIYIISAISLLISFLLLKKSDKALDIVTWIAISIVIMLCYNTFVCYLLSTINIPINLLSLSAINIGLTILFIIFIIKGKRQEYRFDKKDLILLGIIILLTLMVLFKNFGFPLHIQYISSDAGVHYYATHSFYQSESLLNKNGNEMMPGAYSNAGIWLKVMGPFLHDIDLYNVHICFDIFMYFITGLLMYVALKKIKNSKKLLPLYIFITFIYFLGYPLNTLLFGYFYLQLGIIVFSTIIILMMFFKENIIHSKYMIPMLFLLCLELFFSYYLFVPVVYGALGIYYIYYFYKKNKKLFNKEVFIYIFFTLVIPFIIGFIYQILPSLVATNINSSNNAVNIISVEGYIYRNFITNILLFIPFILYYVIKKKEINYTTTLLVILVLFMGLLLIGCSFKMVSTYYFYKTYFVLWFLVLYLFGCSVIHIIENENKGEVIVYTFIISYLVLLFVSLSIQSIKVNKDYDTHETLADVMNIYGVNKSILIDPYKDFITEEIDILKYIKNEINITENTNFMFILDPEQEFWIWGMFGYKNRENLEEQIEYEEIKKCNSNQKYDYIIYFNRSKFYDFYKQYINLDKPVLYSNDSGGVLKNE